jgi:hypothetical protein
MYYLTEEQIQFLNETFCTLRSNNLGLAIVGDYTSLEGVQRQVDRINSGEVTFTGQEPSVFYMASKYDKTDEGCTHVHYVIEKLTPRSRHLPEECS